MLIAFVSILMIIGGTLCGIEEEAVAFYPVLVPIFIALGYDSIVSVGAIFLASSVGSTFSTINPFSVVIASNAAGTTFTDGLYWRIGACIIGAIFVISYLFWYCKKLKKILNPLILTKTKQHLKNNGLCFMMTVLLSLHYVKRLFLRFSSYRFPIMVWGVMTQGWWFPVTASAFLIFTIVIMFIAGTGQYGLGEKGTVDAFVNGASSLVGVSLIIGLARGINLVLNKGSFLKA